VSERLIINRSHRYLQWQSRSRRAIHSRSVTQDEIRVVIIEDNESVRNVVRDVIAAFGHRAFTAANGVQGLREVREHRPQVVLLDLTLPGLDGHAVFEQLIASSAPSSIVILSGSNDEATARALLQRGAFDYLPKPVDLAHLQSVIAAAAAVTPPA
jgi:DNA-binding response OmpR family regulator